MQLKHFTVFADDANISGLYNPAGNFKPSVAARISDLINPNAAGFDVISLIFTIVGLLFFVNFVAAGWDFLLSSGDPKKAAVASGRMTNGVTGLAMVFTAYLVVKVVSRLLGLGANI